MRILVVDDSLAVMEKDIPHSGSMVDQRVTLSLGVATFSGQFKTAEAITEPTDQALYYAKANGRNRVELA